MVATLLVIWVSHHVAFRRTFELFTNITLSIAEEIEGADIVIPRSMITSVAVNGCLGFGMVIATLLYLGDVEDVLASPTGFPFIQILQNATGSNSGATAMV